MEGVNAGIQQPNLYRAPLEERLIIENRWVVSMRLKHALQGSANKSGETGIDAVRCFIGVVAGSAEAGQ